LDREEPHPYGTQISGIPSLSMIARMLPYLQWKFGMDNQKKGQIAKWFKPAAQVQVADAYWDLADECIKIPATKCCQKYLLMNTTCIASIKVQEGGLLK